MEVDGRIPSLPNSHLEGTSQGEHTGSVDRSGRSGKVPDSEDSGGEHVQLFMAELSEVSDVRQGRVEALQQAISQGTYRLDAHEIAGAMMSQVLG